MEAPLMAPSNNLVYDDSFMVDTLERCRVIAVVGLSDNWNRPSSFAAKYMQTKGFKIIPVNPKIAAAGGEILGETAYAALSDIPGKFDMVDIFRKPEAVPGIVDEAIALKDDKAISCIWMQLGVIHREAAATAEAAGFDVVMDRCVKIEYGRLCGELAWGGINSGIITSRRRKLIA